jgi:hypothetical protein
MEPGDSQSSGRTQPVSGGETVPPSDDETVRAAPVDPVAPTRPARCRCSSQCSSVASAHVLETHAGSVVDSDGDTSDNASDGASDSTGDNLPSTNEKVVADDDDDDSDSDDDDDDEDDDDDSGEEEEEEVEEGDVVVLEDSEEEGEEGEGDEEEGDTSDSFIDTRRRSEIEVDDTLSSQELAAYEARACTIDLPLPRQVLPSGMALRGRPEPRRPSVVDSSAAAAVADPHEDYVRGIEAMRHYAVLNGLDTSGIDSARVTVRSLRTRVYRIYSQLREVTGCYNDTTDTGSSSSPSSLGDSDVSWVVGDSVSPQPSPKRRRVSRAVVSSDDEQENSE